MSFVSRSLYRVVPLIAVLALGSAAAATAGVLSITKTGPGGAKPGDQIVYTITIANTGAGDLAAVTLDDPTPTGLSLVSVSGDCTAFATCTFATLASGSSKTVLATFSVPSSYNGPNPIVNTAVTHAGIADAVTATASTAVTRVIGLHTLPPCRIVDTRLTTGVPIGGPALGPKETRTLDVREACGLPGNAFGISYTATVTDPTAPGNVRLFPGGTGLPNTSAINYGPGQTRANNGIVLLSVDGKLGVYCDQGAGTTDLILDVNGYFVSTDAVATPAGQNVHIRPAPEVALTFDNVTQAGVTTALVLDFADNRAGAVDQDLKLFFPAGSAERALVPSVVVPSYIKPLGSGGPTGTPTFVLAIISTTAKFARTAEFHGFEDFRLGWNPPCVVASDPTQEPRTFYAREAGEPALVEETGFGGPVFVDISSGCGSNKGSGWTFSLYLTAKDTRTPHDIAVYMLNHMQSALSTYSASITSPTVATQLGNQVTAALATLDTNAAGSADDMAAFFGIVDGNPTAFDNSARNVSGEMVGRALSARYVIRKLIPSGTITEFSLPNGSHPRGIAAGPDGNLWFTESGQVGRITPAGAVTVFPDNFLSTNPAEITAGPDGNLWFTGSENTGAGKIGRVTPTGSFLTEFTLLGGTPEGIAAGPDGNLWFAQVNPQVGRITPGGSVTEFPLADPGSISYYIAAGPDGNFWFADVNGAIGRITTAGAITEFPIPTPSDAPWGITAGPDGNLWFTERIGNKIGRITPAGVITEFPVPTANSALQAITAGPDGSLWFTENQGNKIGRVTTAGAITEFPIPTADSNPWGIIAGPDGNIWFGENSGKIGRITP